MDQSFETGQRVKVIPSSTPTPTLRPEDMSRLLGSEGTVSGRTSGELIEVRIMGYVFHHEYLLHPSQLEAVEEEPMPEGQLCDRIKNYAVHESYSATRGPRRGRCERLATSKDWSGTWACSIHLGADKRGEQNRKRGMERRSWRNSSEGRAFLQNLGKETR
jgi:hypothetical protein